MKEKAVELFNEGYLKLREANTELCRPEEDVVTALVCSNSHAAIENYLFYDDKTRMLFGNAKDSLQKLVSEIKLFEGVPDVAFRHPRG